MSLPRPYQNGAFIWYHDSRFSTFEFFAGCAGGGGSKAARLALGKLMHWFNRMLDRLVPVTTGGIALEGDEVWMLEGAVIGEQGRDLGRLVTCAAELFPSDCILYLEGTSIVPSVKAFLDANKVAELCRIARATTWPRPLVFHVTLTTEIAGQLEKLCGRKPPGELCDHLHVYHDGEILLQGHDVGWEPLLVSMTVSESRIASFCQHAGCSYRRTFGTV